MDLDNQVVSTSQWGKAYDILCSTLSIVITQVPHQITENDMTEDYVNDWLEELDNRLDELEKKVSLICLLVDNHLLASNPGSFKNKENQNERQ